MKVNPHGVSCKCCNDDMHFLKDTYLAAYRQHLTSDLSGAVQALQVTQPSQHDFTFYTSVAVMASSRIEGERLEVDSYVKHKMQDIAYLPELVEKPNDLYSAYVFARQNELNLANFLQAHKLLSAHLLPEQWRGAWRKNEMLVLEHNTGKIQFEAAPFRIVGDEMKKLWQDIEMLGGTELSIEEVFYYASFIHLVFVSIHPFNDGNGRAGRLLEKWFLVSKLGERAWYIRSEKYCHEHVNDYYRNLNRLGMFYEQMDYEQAMPFLMLLPGSV